MRATITGVGNGSAPVVNLTFPYLDKSHVKATVAGAPAALTWTNTSQVQFSVNAPSGAIWKVYRETPTDMVDFTDASPITETDLDTANTAHGYRDEELNDLIDQANLDQGAAMSAEQAARSALENRTVRAPGGEILSVLSSAAARAGKLLGFSSSGDASVTALSAVDYSTNQAKIADSRTVLSAYTGMAPSQTAILGEEGREGIFKWSPSDLSAMVDLDPRQAIYIAPNSDPTGNSGAWVRVYSGPLNIKWFGARGDDATNDGPVFQDALDFIFGTRLTTPFLYAWGGSALFIPKGRYFLGTTTLNLTTSFHLFGEGGGYESASSVLRWAANATGIVVHSDSSSGVGGPALGSVIEHLGLQGGYAGTEGEYHGIWVRGTAIIRNVAIYNFQGDGIHGNAAAGAGGTLEGNFNTSRFEHLDLEQNRNGMWLQGADGNACTISGCSAISNRAWGFYDASFLGNFYYGLHAASNVAGPYGMDLAGLSNASKYDGCYSESDQPPSQFTWKTAIVGGFHAAGASGGGSLGVANNRIQLSDTEIQGDLFADQDVDITGALTARTGLSVPGKFVLDANGNIVSFGDSLSLGLATAVLKIGGSQVVGPQQGGTAPDAGDLASVITLANGLKAQLRAHGLIA